jgi:hypothetical protein
MSEPSEDEFSNFVNRYMIVQDTKCYRHCHSGAKFVALKADRPGIIGGYFCPGNYASRVVYFSLHPDRDWFEKFLVDQVGERVRSRDIRYATRHGWELGGDAETEIKEISTDGITQLYWTAYPASEEEKSSGAFRCENCGRLFVKTFSDKSKLCPDCR